VPPILMAKANNGVITDAMVRQVSPTQIDRQGAPGGVSRWRVAVGAERAEAE
jgi:hypothetical protein